MPVKWLSMRTSVPAGRAGQVATSTSTQRPQVPSRRECECKWSRTGKAERKREWKRQRHQVNFIYARTFPSQELASR